MTPRSHPLQVSIGNVGDHVLVVELLRAAGQAHSAEDFASWLDEPSYEPADRIVVRQVGRIVAHAQVLFRSAWFGGVKLPVAGLIDLAALPELHTDGWEPRVLATAEQLMRDEGAIVSLVRTNRPEVLAQAGWTAAEPHGFSQANSRDILSHMNMQAAIRRPGGKQFHVRMWRHFELEALMPVYRAAAHERWGTVARGQPYWHWLLTRKAHDQVIVAIEGPDPIHELIDQFASHDEHRPADAPVAAHLMPQIVAYAVVQGSRVVEMFCRPGYDVAGPLVLARACRDAIEQDHHAITLHTAADDPMHELLVTAGGTWCTNAKGTDGVLMIKLLDPSRWTEQMYPLLHHRAKQSGVTRPLEIGFSVGARRFRFRLTRRSSRFESSTAAADDVRCRPGAVEAMMLGTSTVAQLVDAGQIVVRRDELLEPLTALFPSQLYWQSPFDLLRF